MYKRILAIMVLLCLLCVPVHAAQENSAVQEDSAAQEDFATQVKISIKGTGYNGFDFLTNGSENGYLTPTKICTLRITSKTPFQGLYIRFHLECQPYTLTDNLTGESISAGEYGMLHEYVTLPQATTDVTIQFTDKELLTEITAYTPGQPPAHVQIWAPPHDDGADILLLSAHGDDEHLFFAGLLPLYAAERNLRVQVAYLTPHREPHTARAHEMLNGLWNVGVRNYPELGRFMDFLMEDLESTYAYYKRHGVSKEELVGYVVELLRRFKPQVVVAHDFNGEYGHGMHMLYVDLLVQALPLANDPEAYPELAEKYGLWDVPKVYVHLYEENPIVIDYDVPLESFDGMTAFQVSQNYGFPSHKSQQMHPIFVNWIYGYQKEITKATQIEEYNPAHFGLYRSLVGEDILKNDFMENLIGYDEQILLEAQRLEAERLEAERLEKEQLKKQEQQKLEAERQLAQRLEQRREEKRLEILRKEQQQQTTRLILIWSGAALIVGIGLVFVFLKKKKA